VFVLVLRAALSITKMLGDDIYQFYDFFTMTL
jgi:hypothetical protein